MMTLRMHSYEVTTEQFNGPIDTLLYFIEKKKLSISDFSLAQITQDFIDFVRRNEDLIDIKEKTHFISIISILILIKSKALIPQFELNEEEEGDIEELKRRLRIYKIFQDLAKEIQNESKKKKKLVFPKARKKEISFSPAQNISRDSIRDSLMELLSLNESLVKQYTQKKGHVVRLKVHIQDMINIIFERVKRMRKSLTLSELKDMFIHTHHGNETGDIRAQEKVYTLVSFLAGLELARNGEIEITQEEHFSEIEFSPRDDIVEDEYKGHKNI